jgi:hypothetical protein
VLSRVRPISWATDFGYSRSVNMRGFLIALALATFFSNCSVSAMSRRIHSPTKPTAAPIRNGIRHPQLANWSSASVLARKAPSSEASSTAVPVET